MSTPASITPSRRPRVKETGSDMLFTVVNSTVLALFTVAVLYPLIYVVSASISLPEAVQAGRVMLLPVGFTLRAYETVFKYGRIWTSFMNSIFYAVVGTLFNVAMTLMAAYPLSRRDLLGRDVFMMLFLFTMLFSGGLIPTYLLVSQLGLLNTRWALIIPQGLSVWNLIITVTYMRTSIPVELLEAAQLDGASDIRYFLRVALPLCTPIIAVLGLFYAVGHWNQFFTALIYLSNKDLFPLQIVLREILVQNQMDFAQMYDVQELMRREGMRELLKYALIIVASVPVLIAYPFVQRYFVRGMLIGAVKG